MVHIVAVHIPTAAPATVRPTLTETLTYTAGTQTDFYRDCHNTVTRAQGRNALLRHLADDGPPRLHGASETEHTETTETLHATLTLTITETHTWGNV